MRRVHPATLISAAVALVAATLLATPVVNASAQPNPGQLASTLAGQLGARTAGSYLDTGSGKLVVTVADDAAAQTVRKAGAVAKRVAHSGGQLNQITAAFDRSVTVAGTAWAVNPQLNQVVLSVDDSVTGAKLAKVQAAAKAYGSAVRIEHVSGTFTTMIAGGQAIYTGGSRCSLGFNVRNSAGQTFFLTAGHCTNAGATWYANSNQSTVLGTRTGSSFPSNDYGIVRYTNTSVPTPGSVFTYNGSQDITSAANPVVNQTASRSGSTTRVRTGRVTALNQTVRYPQGTVTGLIRTTICAQPGDSGGSMYSGTTAHGLTSGGSGNCTFGGTTFFQPVVEALGVFGVNVY